MAKQRYTRKQIIEALDKSSGLISVAAKRLGCEQRTIHNYISRYPEIADVLKEKRESLVDLAQAKLVEQVKKGESWAVLFTLRTLGKERGFTERQEVTGMDGKPFKIYIATSEFDPNDA